MENNIQCPYCAEEIKSEAKICKHCKKDLMTSEAKNLINKKLNKIKNEQNKKEIENLANKLEKKLERYPEKIKNKLKNDKNFLNKLENMSEDEIDKDIFNRERNNNLKILWISSIFIGFMFPIIYLATIWLYPKKDEKEIFVNRFKNFKNHKVRIVLSIIFLLFFGIFYSENQEVKKEELKEQQRVEKINNTNIKATYDINENITDKKEVNITLELKNIKSLKINNKDITLSGSILNYKQNLELGENTIFIVGFNDDIEKKVTNKIKRVTNDEYIKFKEEEKQRQIELAEQQKLKQEEENRIKEVEKQFNGWDGSHIGLTRYLESSLKDPDSYEHIETKYGILQDTEGSYYVKVITKYRAKNSFGGYVIGNIQAYFDIEGKPIKTENWLSY